MLFASYFFSQSLCESLKVTVESSPNNNHGGTTEVIKFNRVS